MAKVTAKNGDGADVPVLQAQFNNRGQVESFLTVVDTHQKWVHARDYKVTVEDGEQPIVQPGIMTKDTQLKGNETLKKTEAAPAADPVEPAAGGQDAAPAEPVDDSILSKNDIEPDEEADTQLPEPTSAPELPEPTPGKPTKPAKK